MISISNLMQRGFKMRKEKSVKKINLCFLAGIVILNAGIGAFGVYDAYAEEYSFTPTGETYSLAAGQAQSFVTNVDTAGVIQALDALDSQTACQEKVCVCRYQVEVLTLKLYDDGMIEQIGSTVSDAYNCRDIKGGVGPATVAYGLSIADPGTNYYVNIAQRVSAEGADFGAGDTVRMVGGLEVHQVNVIGKNAVEESVDDLNKNEVEDENPEEDEDAAKAADEDTEQVDDNDRDWEYFQSGIEFELADSEISVSDIEKMLAEETGGTFTVKVNDGAILNSAILAAIKTSGKNLSIKKYQGDQVLYEWKIRNSAINATKDFDPTVSFVAGEKAEIEQVLSGLKVIGGADKMYFGTAQDGALPEGTKLRVLVNDAVIDGAERLNLYNYDEDLGEVEVAYESIRVNSGYAEFAVARGSKGYFLTSAQIVTVGSEEAAPSARDEEQKINWLLVGLLGVGGTGALGLVGFCFWKKAKHKDSSAAMNSEEMVEDLGESIEKGGDAMDALSDEVKTPELKVAEPRVMRPIARNSRRTMDMVRRPQAVRPAHAGAISDVAIKGSSKRLIIS